MLTSAAFLPFTLAVIGRPANDRTRCGTRLRVAADATHQAERHAWAVWQSLLGGYDSPARAALPSTLRRLTWAVRGFAGSDWWDGVGSAHRDRVARYQDWLDEALADDDGEGFAAAFAGYDEALARAVVCTMPSRPAGGRPAYTAVRRSGTMAGWASQARAVTSRVTSGATQPAAAHSATSRRATSSSKWSRRSRSAG